MGACSPQVGSHLLPGPELPQGHPWGSEPLKVQSASPRGWQWRYGHKRDFVPLFHVGARCCVSKHGVALMWGIRAFLSHPCTPLQSPNSPTVFPVQ